MTDTASADAAPASTESSDTAAPVGEGSSSPTPSSDPVSGGSTGQVEAEGSILDLDLPAGMKQFDRAYVEKLRGEAATNRTKAREAEARAIAQQAALERFSAFDGYADEDMAIWTKMASDWKGGDYTAVATVMQEIASNVLADPNASPAEKAEARATIADPTAAVAEATSLTPDEVRRIAREESQATDAEKQQQAQIEGVFTQIREAGYEDNSPESSLVLWYAVNRTEGDIAAAIELKKADDQRIIDTYVQSVAKGGTPVRMPSIGSSGSPTQEAPKNLVEARHAAQAWLDQRRANGA